MSTRRGYAIGPGWKGILHTVGVDPSEVLRRAQLPDDLFQQEDVRLDTEAFFRFSQALDDTVANPAFWVQLTEAMQPEYFTPPLFAALCSPDLRTAAHRLALFKPLIGPITLDVHEGNEGLELAYRWREAALPPPPHLHAVEALFITQLARLGTRSQVRPTRVTVPALPASPAPFEAYLGLRLTVGERLSVRFTGLDARRPFLTANPAMWNIFEPELRRRLTDLTAEATVAERTRAVLLEALPSGTTRASSVARRRAMSTRTLQRRLRAEGTTFQEVVDQTRASLARHYLQQTPLSSTEIAYLLGFDEPTSFFRAFQRWTGTTPDALRRERAAAGR